MQSKENDHLFASVHLRKWFWETACLSVNKSVKFSM